MHVPQHSITATPRYVRSAAFDLDRVKRERATMPDGGDGHPVVLYFAGESRFDLDAPHPVGEQIHSAREYLLPDHGAKIWEMRRLRPMECARCRDVGDNAGKLTAFALTMGTPGRPLTDEQIEAYVDECGLEELYAVGDAALRASEAPKAAEKKR